MCFGEQVEKEKIYESWKKIEHRGRDYFKVWVDGEEIVGGSIEECINQVPEKFSVFLAQNTLSITGEPGFPREFDGKVLVANAEVFNWKELGDYNSDLEAFFYHDLTEINGIFACAVYDVNKRTLSLFRDVLGVNPLCYSINDGFFAFASEGKALSVFGQYTHLDPRKMLEISATGKPRVKNNPQKINWFPKNWHTDWEKLEETLLNSINIQTQNLKSFGIMFSGGVDSTFLAKVSRELDRNFTCYTFGMEESQDIEWARKVSEELGFSLKEYILGDIYEVEELLPKLIYIIEEDDVMKLSVAIPFYYVGAMAKKDKNKVVLSGLGSEELFAGYERHKGSTPEEVHRNCVDGLKSMWLRDLYRDNCVLMWNTQELRVPFLDLDVVNTALSFDPSYRIYQGYKKYVFRKIAEKYIGSPAWRPKKAAQYGSGVMKVLKKLAKERGFSYIRDYITHLNTSYSDKDTI